MNNSLIGIISIELGSSILALVGWIFFFSLIISIYRKFKLIQFLLKLIQAALGLTYIFLNFFAVFTVDLLLAKYLYSLSIICFSLIGILEGLFFHSLRATKMTIQYSAVPIGIILIKLSTLITYPIETYRYNGITLRTAHIHPLALLSTYIIISYILVEFFLFFFEVWKVNKKRSFAIKLSMVYLTLPPFLSVIYYLARKSPLLSISIPYIQAIVLGIWFQVIVFIFRKNPEKLILLPVRIRGFLMHTYGGIPLLKEPFEPGDARTVTVASSLIGAIIGLEEAIEKRRVNNIFRVHQLVETALVTFFGEMTLGTFICSKDNIVLRNILSKLIKEFEQEIGYIDEGMVLDEDIQIARKILYKYVAPFL